MYKQQHATHLRTPLQPITVFYGALPYIIEVLYRLFFAQTYRYRIRRNSDTTKMNGILVNMK